MNIRTFFLLLFGLLVFGCSKNEIDSHQLNTELYLSKPNNDEISMESYFPSPHVNVNLENELLQALESKFESSSDIEITILDKDQSGESKAMYYVWVRVSILPNSHEKGLALVTVGISPEVFEYYTESQVLNTLDGANSVPNIPQDILAEIKALL